MFKESVFILFLTVTILHLVFCFLHQEYLRKITKVLIIPLLALFLYASGVGYHIIYLALAFGWLGDIVLLVDDDFTPICIGTGLFYIGHIFYCIAMNNIIGGIHWVFYIILPVVFALFIVAWYFLKKKQMGKQTIFFGCYAYILATLALFGVLAAIKVNISYLFVTLGAILFIISDTFLSDGFYQEADKRMKLYNFVVMATYIAAQFAIIAAFILNLGAI